MQTLLQSAFLQALTYSLAASIWQMAFIWLAAVCLLKLFTFTSSQKFNIAFIAQASGLVLFAFSFWDAYKNPGRQITVANFPGALEVINSFIISYLPYMAIVYLFVFIYKLAKFVFSYNEVKKIRKQELKKIAPQYRVFVQNMSSLLSVHKKVKIYLSEKIICPLTTGFLKPVILIPAAAVNHLTAEQMEAVILHELAHIKRADYILFIIQSFIDRIFFFNIFSIMLSDIIERERENACDDLVMQFRYSPMHYAEALFKLGRIKTLPALAMPLSGKKDSLLLVRIKRLLHKPQSKYSYNLQPVLFGIFSVAMAVCLFCFSFKTEAGLKTTNAAIAAKITPVEILQPAASAKVEGKKSVQIKIAEEEQKAAGIKLNKEAEADIACGQKEQAEDLYNDEFAAYQDALKNKQSQLLQVQYKLDSLRYVLPQVTSAVNAQVVVTPQLLQKAISYQNFKTLENMLAVSGNNIKITESDSTKNSYQKLITIESSDKNGNKHIYKVVVQLYQ